MIERFAYLWADFIYRRALLVLITAMLITLLAVRALGVLSVSTQIEALMPQGTNSVKTLNAALRKTGSFASIQIVASSNTAEQTLDFIRAAKVDIDHYDWVQSSQYSEDVSVLEQHKLLLMDIHELRELERDVDKAYSTIIAKRMSERFGAEVTFTLRDENLSGNSNTVLNEERFEDIQNSISDEPTTERFFISPDRLTAVLVVWPKPGQDSLGNAKSMIEDSKSVVSKLNATAKFTHVKTGVAGRIANKVAQFDAIMGDLKLGLFTSLILIALLLGISYRSLAALPIIVIPLLTGIVWTLAMTTVTIGGLNLITVFLTLILFGLGIDFGIHNFSRYREERRSGKPETEALQVIVRETGGASLIAAMTTALAFFSLTFTEFRAFTEFGFIAAMGIILTFLSMYSILPALLIVFERCGWKADKAQLLRSESPSDQTPEFTLLSPLQNVKASFLIITALVIFSIIFAPKIAFERNIKTLEAKQPSALIEATQAASRVFSDGHDRAIIVVETVSELSALDSYFKTLIETDLTTPTLKKVTSLLDFVPDQDAQKERLAVIRRLENRAKSLQIFDPEKYTATKHYLSIKDLNTADLPPALRRTFLGTESEPGYLMYIYNSISMDDSRTARLFYDDAAEVLVGGKSYYAASEGFIFVEMIALMKADAIKAISLVTLTTALLIFIFTKSLKATAVILTPPLLGVLLTVALMGAFGPNLSIMNMVILPSLIGIAVDNSIHIFHRFESEGKAVDIPKIMSSTGRAAALTTFTTLIGFGGMVTASMGGLRSMGVLAIIGFLSCLFMTWVLLPLLLQTFYNKETPHG